MSIANEKLNGLNLHEACTESQKRSRLLYTREFLLSLSNLDVCKRLPSGFDQSLLSEFEDTSQDRFRASGGFSSQSYKRTEYGSSPPTRGDTSNFPRGIQGRWDSRSSVRSDRDSVSQSEKESDTGGRYANQSRRPWQVPEHDGLLGSGSFTRPSGLAVGSSASTFREPSEPYYPPRPYKATPNSRRDITDSFNDETFGSSECTTEDREEEEKKRRASFDLLRKEHHKAFHERQKLNPGKGKDDFNFSSLMGDSSDNKRSQDRSNELNGPVSSNNSHKAATSSVPSSRPLVPPGFSNASAEKSTGTKVVTNSQLEVVNEVEGSHNKGNNLFLGASQNQEQVQRLESLNVSEQELGNFSINVSVNSSKGQKLLDLPSTVDASSKLIGKDAQFYKTLELLEGFETQKNGGVTDLSVEDVVKGKFNGGSDPTGSTSILEQLFGNALAPNGDDSSSSVEGGWASFNIFFPKQHGPKMEEAWISSDVQSSKFAQWFLEEEKNPVDDVSSGGPNSLLSLIVGGEKGLSHPTDGRTAKQHILPDLSVRHGELADKDRRSSSVLAAIKDTEKSPPFSDYKVEPVTAVLTCEDLEQLILSGITGSGSSLSANERGRNVVDQKTLKLEATLQLKAKADDHASQNILSLLQKGTSLDDAFPSAILGTKSVDNIKDIEEPSIGLPGISISSDTEHSVTLGKALTLETLFGTAFMKELQPVGVPTASQPAKAGIAKLDIPQFHSPYLEGDGGLLLSTLGMTSNISGLGSGVPPSNQPRQIKSDRIEDHFIALNSSNKVDTSQIQSELVSRLGGQVSCAEIGLPEEDSLLAVSDPLNAYDLVHARNTSDKIEVLGTQEMTVDIAEKLAALSSFRDERSLIGDQGGPPFGRNPYEAREQEVQYQNIRVRPSPHQLNPSQINNAELMFHSLDSHSPKINAQMRFISPENVIHRHAPSNHYHGNMFHHLNGGSTLTGFDPSPQNALLQQMHMTDNFPHISRGFPTGAPAVPHLNNQMPGFIPDANPMQNFPFGQRPTNLGAVAIPSHAPGVDSGTNRPEALQKLIEMELRLKPKQVHPLAAVGHGQGPFGHEHMGFGYR
ncbi:unnamed protein product [Linum tenue]|uniref:Uncharacterized protein n=1 Tax=Linum tenue TaxID=586396 RepID=A0AAV0KTK0_9ROSI|nr:unnamed protein product [Linum tenue]